MVIGHIDNMGSIISGWVWGGTEERLRVVCRIDKVTEIEVVASQYRPDVRNAGYGDGYSGFSLQIPERLCDRQEHWLELLVPERPGWSFPGVPAHAVFGIPEIRVAQIGPNHTQAYADYWMRHLQSELGTVLSQESIALYVKNQLALLGQSNNAAFALPPIVSRTFDHACPHGIQFNIAVAVQQVVPRLHQAGFKPPFPERA